MRVWTVSNDDGADQGHVMHLDTARKIGLVDLNLVGEGQSGHLTSAEVAAGK
jgi:hypothetical protein